MSFKPMLAKDADPEKIRYPVIAQIKLDGVRAVVKDGKLLSRTLKPIPNAEIREFLARPEFEGLDGELIVGDPAAQGCYRRTSSFVMSESKTGEPWAFHVFDSFSDPSAPYVTRYSRLGTIPLSDRVILVRSQLAADAEALAKIEAELVGAGHEGVMIRDPQGHYKFGRSYPRDGLLLKVKRFIDFEAEVIGVFERMHNANEAKTNALGRTERSTAKAGMVGRGDLGGLVLRALNGPHQGQEFRCGTGFDDAQRADLWAKAGSMRDPVASGDEARIGLNKGIAKIKSFPLGVKDAPRFPVFLGWRDMELDG